MVQTTRKAIDHAHVDLADVHVHKASAMEHSSIVFFGVQVFMHRVDPKHR